MIAALYVQRNGAYFGLEGVDPWDEVRDARFYVGPWPVVAHPPCARWCQVAGLVEARWGHAKGDDGGTFAAALASVRRFGGVLEHPAFTKAWPAYDLPAPSARGWSRSAFCGGWTCEVSQAAYGHRARKLTWLYYVGATAPPALDWTRPPHSARVSQLQNHGQSKVELMSHRERSATPLAFREVLLGLARGTGGPS